MSIQKKDDRESVRSGQDHHKPSPGLFQPGGRKPLMAMIEVTNRCNMSCPICFTDALPDAADVPLEKIELYLKNLLEITESPIPLQISGGEPSLRDDLPEIVSLAKNMGYMNIELVTNGIRIANETGFLEELKNCGLTAVYLQFDGLLPQTTKKIRGRDMTQIRSKAITAIRDTELCCTLAVVVTRGVNDGEIGDIVNFALTNIDVVRAINFQSAARLSGRFEIDESYQGYTLSELLECIAGQTNIPANTFLSEHLGHPACNAMSPVFVVNGKLKPLFAHISGKDLLDYLGGDGREKILATFAGKKDFFFRHLVNPKSWQLLAKAAPIFGSNPYNVLTSKHLLIFAKTFMEKESLDQDRLDNCCYGVTGEGGVYSFCAFNTLYRPTQTCIQ